MDAMTIPDVWHRVPDVAVAGAGALESFFQETPPELVVEVASPRTRLYDRNRKKDIYQGFGIPAYWIVEPSRDRPELTSSSFVRALTNRTLTSLAPRSIAQGFRSR
jgi:Uma2 family endonuclease